MKSILIKIICSIVISTLVLTACTQQGETENKLYVAAASQLYNVFSDIGEAFEQETGIEVVFTFSSTGLLTQQIIQGAPYDLFAAADEASIDTLINRQAVLQNSREIYAIGRLAFMYAGEEVVTKELLLDPKIKTIAIANPEHAPYGRAAKETLQKWGIWEEVQPKLVFAENIRQAYQFVSTGNADIGMIAYALLIHDDFPSQLIDEHDHHPITQALGITSQSKNTTLGKQFSDFILSEQGREILLQYGYDLP